MNLSQIRSYVRSLTGIPSADIISNADINQFINESYFEILREADWNFLRASTTLTLSSGVASYALPANVNEGQIASVTVLSDDTNRRQLRPRNRYTTDDSPGPLNVGKPMEYSVYNGNIQFFPTPDSNEVVTFRYFTIQPELSIDADVPQFDSKYHYIIAYGAAIKVLFREGDDTERRKFYTEQFYRGLDQMKIQLLSERDRSIFRIGGRRRIYGRRDPFYGV